MTKEQLDFTADNISPLYEKFYKSTSPGERDVLWTEITTQLDKLMRLGAYGEKWKMFKNYLHNELQISEADIKQWTQDAVKEVAVNYVKHQLSENTMTDIVKKVIKANSFWGEAYNDKVVTEVAKQLAKQVIIKEKPHVIE